MYLYFKLLKLFLTPIAIQKPEVDIGSVNQSMPLDISGTTTPSEHDAPNSQSSHSGKSRKESKMLKINMK